MEEEYLRDIRALLITQRAIQVRGEINKARNEDEIEEAEGSLGNPIRMLTWERALELASKEMRFNRAIIAKHLGD